MVQGMELWNFCSSVFSTEGATYIPRAAITLAIGPRSSSVCFILPSSLYARLKYVHKTRKPDGLTVETHNHRFITDVSQLEVFQHGKLKAHKKIRL